MLNEQVKLHGYTKNAIDETLRLCRDKDILKEYLEKRKTEVITMLDSLFDDDEIMEMHDNRIWREAEEATAKKVAKEAAIKMIKSGKLSLEEINSFLPALSMNELKKIAEEIK